MPPPSKHTLVVVRTQSVVKVGVGVGVGVGASLNSGGRVVVVVVVGALGMHNTVALPKVSPSRVRSLARSCGTRGQLSVWSFVPCCLWILLFLLSLGASCGSRKQSVGRSSVPARKGTVPNYRLRFGLSFGARSTFTPILQPRQCP